MISPLVHAATAVANNTIATVRGRVSRTYLPISVLFALKHRIVRQNIEHRNIRTSDIEKGKRERRCGRHLGTHCGRRKREFYWTLFTSPFGVPCWIVCG